MTNKLYLVELRGMKYAASGPAYGSAYVIASDPGEAYEKVLSSLSERDIGFRHERELDRVTLLAEAVQYPECKTILYL